MRVTTTFGTAGYVVKIINARDRKRDMTIALDEGQVSSGVPYFGEQYDLAVVDTEFGLHDAFACDWRWLMSREATMLRTTGAREDAFTTGDCTDPGGITLSRP